MVQKTALLLEKREKIWVSGEVTGSKHKKQTLQSEEDGFIGLLEFQVGTDIHSFIHSFTHSYCVYSFYNLCKC